MAQRQVTVVIVGAGNRGMVYQQFAIEHPDQCKVFLLLFTFRRRVRQTSNKRQTTNAQSDNDGKRWWLLQTPWPFAGNKLRGTTVCPTIASLRATLPSKTFQDSQIVPLSLSTIDFIAQSLSCSPQSASLFSHSLCFSCLVKPFDVLNGLWTWNKEDITSSSKSRWRCRWKNVARLSRRLSRGV